MADRLRWIESLKLEPAEELLANSAAVLERLAERGVPGLRVEVDWEAFLQGLKDAPR